MSASPTARFASRSEAVANGYFSRRHRTNEAHNAAIQRRERRIVVQANLAKFNKEVNAGLSPAERIKRLDINGYDAKKERKRLSKRI